MLRLFLVIRLLVVAAAVVVEDEDETRVWRAAAAAARGRDNDHVLRNLERRAACGENGDRNIWNFDQMVLFVGAGNGERDFVGPVHLRILGPPGACFACHEDLLGFAPVDLREDKVLTLRDVELALIAHNPNIHSIARPGAQVDQEGSWRGQGAERGCQVDRVGSDVLWDDVERATAIDTKLCLPLRVVHSLDTALLVVAAASLLKAAAARLEVTFSICAAQLLRCVR
eukprot:762521-Hanusia_phi.AAC.39